MKNFEKIVPVLASGLVVAGLGTADAFAAETPDTQLTLPTENQKEETSAASTTINSVTKTEPEQTEDGGTEFTGVVNLGVDTDNNSLTNDGNITVTEKPTDKTQIKGDPKPAGDPVVTPNPGGGSTSTTPTEVEVTETEKSEIDIEGEIKPQAPAPVTKPTEDEVKDLGDALESTTNLGGIEAGKNYGGFTASAPTTSEETQYEDPTTGRTGTQTTTTVTFEKVVTGETKKPLTTDDGTGEGFGEFGKIVDEMFGLGPDVQFTKVDKNTLSYVKDGKTVTVRLETDDSKETQTTTYRIKVSQTTTTLNGESKTDGKDIVDDTIYGDNDNSSAKADEVISNLLKDVETNKDKYTVSQNKSEDGKTTTTTTTIRYDGESPKEYIITETETPLAEAPTKDVLLKWLGDDFELSEKGEIVTKNGGYEVSITTSPTGKTIVRTIQVYDAAEEDKVVDQDGKDIDVDKATNEAMVNAAVEAVKQALVADGITGISDDSIKAQFKNNVWTVIVKATVDGVDKEFTYTVTASSSESSPEVWDASKLQEEEVASGSTTTVTGNAYVSGETVVWSTSKNTQFSITNGKVSYEENAKLNDSETVVSCTTDQQTGKTILTTRSNDGKIKVYEFTYKNVNVSDLNADQKTALLGGVTGDITSGTLQEISWTVTTSETTTFEGGTIVTDGNLTESGNDGYTYTNGDETITFTKDKDGKFTGTGNDGTLYVIEESDIPLEGAPSVENLIRKQYNLGNDIKVNVDTEKKTVTYVKDGITHIVDYSDYKVLQVKKVTTASEDDTVTISGANAVAARDALLETIKKTVEDAEKVGKQVFVTIDGQEYQLSIQNGVLIGLNDGAVKENFVQGELTTWIEKNTAVNFDSMNEAELVQYLENLAKYDSEAWMDRGHLDLVISNSLTIQGVEGQPQDCIVVGDSLHVTVGKTANDIVYGSDNNRDANFKEDIIYDKNTQSYQYGYPSSDRVLESNRYKDFSGEKEDVLHTSEYKYYGIQGTVAYGKVDTYKNWRSAQNALNNLSATERVTATIVKTPKLGSDGKVVKEPGPDGKTVYEYTLYKYTSNLTAYGYLGEKSNVCSSSHKGYDLLLDNLTLLENDRVTASGANTYSYSINLTTKSVASTAVGTGANLVINALTSLTNSGKDSALAGDYQIIQTKTETELGSDFDHATHKGSDTFRYDTYKGWVKDEDGKFTSTSSQYNGSLGYKYSIPEEVTVGNIIIDLDSSSKEVVATRTVAAKLSSTSVSTRTEEGDPIVEVTPPSDNGGGGDNRTPTTPTPPVDIPEEDPPLVDIPEEEPPLVDVPEEEPPLVDVPEEEPPLVDIPDTQPPKVTIPAQKVPLAKAPTPNTVEILEEDVPLADVPETGESPMGLLAAAAACFSALGLGLLKKKHED